MKVSDTHATSNEARWWYPDFPGHKQPPKGRKISLLTKGKIQTTGVWSSDGSMLAWAPLIQRDQKIEDQLESIK